MEFSGHIITVLAGVFAFTSGSIIKSRKWLMVCVVVTVLLIVAGIILMVINYTDWIEKILPLPSRLTWA